MSLLGMTELPKKFEKYDMLEYLATSVPHDKKEYEEEAKALLDLMGTYYTAMGFPIILREMVNQMMTEEYKTRIKSYFRPFGKVDYDNEELEAFGKKFHEAFLGTLEQHWEENEA
jgi:hypothetical protein